MSDAEPSALDERQTEAIVRAVGERGPALMTSRRSSRWLVLGGVVAAAAAAVAFVTTSARETIPAPTAALACAGWRAAQGEFIEQEGARTLDLGRVAFATAAAGSDVRLVTASPCETVLELAAGEVVVHARDLGGGSLVVRAGEREVSVKGTIFGVSRQADAVVVEVAEGRVAVTAGGRPESQMVAAGERLMSSGVGVARGQLGDDRRTRLERAVATTGRVALDVVALDSLVLAPNEAEIATNDQPDAPGASPQTQPRTAGELLRQAEESRRGGDPAGARELYRRAGSMSGPTAEAAWLALARMELSLGSGAGATQAMAQRRQRFGQGSMGPEVLWLEVRSYRAAGDASRARSTAEQLVRSHPSSPQAEAARRLLEGK